ncbi:MAG: hypothetical protein KGN32_00310 [Burkholderiales bacterium]|nr:hypothetical protein [Burkholderiales bacterium]
MKAEGAGAAGAVQAHIFLAPAPQKPSIHAGCGPILSTSAGAAGEFFYFFRKKRKGIEEGRKEEYRKFSKNAPAAPASHAKNVRKSLICIGLLGAGASLFSACNAPAAPALVSPRRIGRKP